MKPSVKLIEGLHITATDKRNILAAIEFLRTEENHAIFVGVKGSPKQYCLGVLDDNPNTYAVVIRENYTTDLGKPRQRQSRVVVSVKGIAPLKSSTRTIAQCELFEDANA